MLEGSNARWLWNSTRFAILTVTLFALTFAFGNSLIFTFTVICMNREVISETGNGTHEIETVDMFSQNEKGLLYSAIAMGALFGSAAIVTLVRKFGARYV